MRSNCPSRSLVLSVVAAGSLLLGAPAAHAGFDPALAFGSRCSGCHSVGRGDVVGPDLKGVNARHDRTWLHAFIHSSQSVIQAGDAAANALFVKYGKQRMPDHPLTVAEIDRVLDFIAKGGPGSGEGSIRHARTATAAEAGLGRDLFLGRRRLANAGVACVQCHVAGATAMIGGTLACDLTGVYSKYQDWGLHRAIQAARFPMMTALYREHPMTADEVFALKAYLYRAGQAKASSREGGSSTFALLSFISSIKSAWHSLNGDAGR